MSRKFLLTGLMASSIIAVALSGAGCKKEEQAKAPETVAAPQAAAPATQAGAVEYTFEDGTGSWYGSDQTVKVEPATDRKHGGKGSIKVSGTSGDGKWNLAISPDFNL